MERLEKLISTLKLTPHRQPELVKEASSRILMRNIKSDPNVCNHIKPFIEILVQYCDEDDSALRSLFNDILNTVLLAFQNRYYQILLHVLLDIVTDNGRARSVAAALQRIPMLIKNVQPIELGCQPQRLVKSLIEVARRSEDESILKALDLTLVTVMPHLEYHVRKSREIQLLTSSLVEVLLCNALQSEIFQTRRLASSMIATICSQSEFLLNSTTVKLLNQFETLSVADISTTSKFSGFCMCVSNLPQFAEKHHKSIVDVILKHIESDNHDITSLSAALSTLRELLKYLDDHDTLNRCAHLLTEKFLTSKDNNGKDIIRKDTKVILQTNSLACISAIIQQSPRLIDNLDFALLYKDHSDVAVRNQVALMIGNYIEASWRFPLCIDQSIDCETVRKLWVELRNILYNETAHPDTIKSCVSAIRICFNTLLESDHCLHIIYHSDLERILHLFRESAFKPLKIEILGLFASLNFRTLHYLEQNHWSKMKAQKASSLANGVQDRILSLIIDSLMDEHQRVRSVASESLISVLPRLYVTKSNGGKSNLHHRYSDSIVSLAQDLSNDHLNILREAEEYVKQLSDIGKSPMDHDIGDRTIIRSERNLLSSSIIEFEDSSLQRKRSSKLNCGNHNPTIISINLMHVLGMLRTALESNLERGKVAVTSLVRTLYDLSLIYPIHQYVSAWDCRTSEYCDSFTLLNFLLTYMENIVEPDVIVDDLDAYKNFIAFFNQILFALCHESKLVEFEYQRTIPSRMREATSKDGDWSDLDVKHSCIAEALNVYVSHLIKLLRILSCTINGGQVNPVSNRSKQPSAQQQELQTPEHPINYELLTSDTLLFNRIHRKLEASFKSSKKNLNQSEEKFYQILEVCLTSLSSSLEFVGMNKSLSHVRDILNYLKITSQISLVSSLVCARQLLKSLFGINILALYQADPHDWFEEEFWSSSQPNLMSIQDDPSPSMQSVYHHLVAHPYKVISNYLSANSTQITPNSDKALAPLNYKSRRTLNIRRRIEDRVKSLFESSGNQFMSQKLKNISETLKTTITEFTAIVDESMCQFAQKGFCVYQTEILQFMSYLVLLGVNYQKLARSKDLIESINMLLDRCGEKVFAYRDLGIEKFLKCSFMLLLLLTYERGPSKATVQVATVIQNFDDLRAKLCMAGRDSRDITTYIVPLLRGLVEDLFVYRTKHYKTIQPLKTLPLVSGDSMSYELIEKSKKDALEIFEAEKETVAQKLLDIIDNPNVYDLLSTLILESRESTNELKYKKLSQQLWAAIPSMLSKRSIETTDSRCIELTRLIENISPEVFQPVNFIFETLLDMPKPAFGLDLKSRQEFQRWMSLVIISIHVLLTQVREETFLIRLRESMTAEAFIDYILHIVQLCSSEILIQMHYPPHKRDEANITVLTQQLSCYILYLTNIFQSGLFFQLCRTAIDIIKKEVNTSKQNTGSFFESCMKIRDHRGGFSLQACETMFYHFRLIFPDLTIIWCNLMMLLNNVDCNRDFWRDLLVYECHQCQFGDYPRVLPSSTTNSSLEKPLIELSSIETNKDDRQLKRSNYINRPSSLNLTDLSFSNHLRRSFIKRITATNDSGDKALNRVLLKDESTNGQSTEFGASVCNIEQCLSPNIELSRRGALCLVLDFVTLSMSDVEHITWLIIHHVNDIIRWSNEVPISEFINAIHGNSASSGIFIQAINSSFNNLGSISLIRRLLWALDQVHYTQYGSVVVLLVEKLLSSDEVIPFRSLTRKIEDFACAMVQKLMNGTNKNLIATNDEFINQLSSEDLHNIYSKLDDNLYPKLTKLLLELRDSIEGQNHDAPRIEVKPVNDDSDDDSESDEIELLYSKAHLVYLLSEQNFTARTSCLIPAMLTIRSLLFNPCVIERINQDEVLVCWLVAAVYSLALNILPPPARIIRPHFWATAEQNIESPPSLPFDVNGFTLENRIGQMALGDLRNPTKLPNSERTFPTKRKSDMTQEEIVENVRTACLRGLFLLENVDYLQLTQFECLNDLIICLARLPLINSFILVPPTLWRQGLWPEKLKDDVYKINFPMPSHDILFRDISLLENFCDRLLKLGWISRRQFEEICMTLLGVLSSALSQPDSSTIARERVGAHEVGKNNSLAACRAVTAITKLLILNRKVIPGNPLSDDVLNAQCFDDRVADWVKAISTNLAPLKKRIRSISESLDSDRRMADTRELDSKFKPRTKINTETGFSDYLKMPAKKLRMNVVLTMEMQDTVIVPSESSTMKTEEVDVESCIRLLLSIYRQKLKDPNETLCSTPQASPSMAANQKPLNNKNIPNQLAPPLAAAICQSILALSDMFTDYEQFDWLFESYVHMFKIAERNEDELQMQFLIIGLCKSAAICCYEIPNELTTLNAINHREIMFEKCRQSIERCVKSEFGPLRTNALFGAYYMLEDSIDIVASGAWELDHFKQLRQSRLSWIVKLTPIILSRENFKFLTKKAQTIELLRAVSEVVTESEVRALKS